MARQTVADAQNFLKELMADPAADVFSDGYSVTLLRLFNEAQDALNETFAEYEIETFHIHADLTNIPAGTSSIGRSGGAPVLPDGLILPTKLWERTTGQTENDWILVEERKELPFTAERGDTFGQWSWESDQIRLSPASNARDLRIEYDGFPAAFTALSDSLPVEGSARCLALYAAATYAGARDQHAIADRYYGKAQKAALALARIHLRDEQSFVTVRRPYRPRSRVWPYDIKVQAG